jgi:hypothetical protein
MRRLAALDWRGLVLALVIGTVGGAVFAWARLPLAWLLGAMVAVTAAATSGVRVRLPAPLATIAYGVLGVVMGTAFSPEIFHHLARFGVTLATLLIYIAVIAVIMLTLFRRVFGFDARTAYFASMPGGIAEMTAIGAAMGGDGRTIALFHGTRILLVAFTIPMGFHFIAGYEPRGVSAMGGGLDSIGIVDYLVFLGCGLAGHFGGRLIRLPAPSLLGGLILSAVAHMAGLTDAKMPFLIIALAQLVIGCGIGSRFAGTSPGEIGRMLAIATAMIALMLLITIGFGLGLERLTDWPVQALLLAYAPGGLPEMTLVALVMGIDVVFVATHHTVRIVFVVALALPVLRLMERRRSRDGAPKE